MRSRSPVIAWLVAKETRELLAARSWWIFLMLIGPLVGVGFIDAVRTYAEASGLNGTAAGVGEAFSPLIGIWAPTFSACELGAAFLLPFVAIRVVAGDKQSGALKIESQQPIGPTIRLVLKVGVLLAGWLIATLAPLVGVLLWRSYGGSVYLPELLSVAAGHVLNAALVIALAAAASCVTEHPATAAIVTLAATVGTWILNFTAAVQGGIWEQAAAYTPTAMVAEMQHGLVRLDVLLVATALVAALIAIGATWLQTGTRVVYRVYRSVALAALTLLVVALAARARPSWDLSESRANSFSRADELALAAIEMPLTIEAHLAPEDPRRSDLEHRALSKLRRAMPDVRVEYVSATSIGLFEQTDPHYGEVRFELGGRTAVTRATTAEGVLETVYELAAVTPPVIPDEDVFRGHPLAVPPKGAAVVFYVVWPVAVAIAALAWRRYA